MNRDRRIQATAAALLLVGLVATGMVLPRLSRKRKGVSGV